MERVLAFGIGQAVEERKPTLPQMRERFAALAKQHQSSLLRIASNFCRGDLHAAQDLVQEALVNGYRAYLGGGFSDGSNAKAWLARILTNVFLNDYRRRKKHQAPVELEEDIASDEGQAADREVLQSVLDEPLQDALRRLPEQQRFCVLLVDLEGLDYAEAAQVLNCPVGTIRSRLARARAALYDDLFDYAKDRGAV